MVPCKSRPSIPYSYVSSTVECYSWGFGFRCLFEKLLRKLKSARRLTLVKHFFLWTLSIFLVLFCQKSSIVITASHLRSSSWYLTVENEEKLNALPWLVLSLLAYAFDRLKIVEILLDCIKRQLSLLLGFSVVEWPDLGSMFHRRPVVFYLAYNLNMPVWMNW